MIDDERSRSRQLISSGSPWELVLGYSRAVRVGDRVLVSGTSPQWPDGRIEPDAGAQVRQCFEIISDALDEAGSCIADIVRTRIYLVDRADFEVVTQVHGSLLADVRPATTIVIVSALIHPSFKVEVEVEALIPPERSPR
jgi:enamine deaminase RidA (YjgF/YER057c/UK114 family)